jgi:hypothetical protein
VFSSKGGKRSVTDSSLDEGKFSSNKAIRNIKIEGKDKRK